MQTRAGRAIRSNCMSEYTKFDWSSIKECKWDSLIEERSWDRFYDSINKRSKDNAIDDRARKSISTVLTVKQITKGESNGR